MTIATGLSACPRAGAGKRGNVAPCFRVWLSLAAQGEDDAQGAHDDQNDENPAADLGAEPVSIGQAVEKVLDRLRHGLEAPSVVVLPTDAERLTERQAVIVVPLEEALRCSANEPSSPIVIRAFADPDGPMPSRTMGWLIRNQHEPASTVAFEMEAQAHLQPSDGLAGGEIKGADSRLVGKAIGASKAQQREISLCLSGLGSTKAGAFREMCCPFGRGVAELMCCPAHLCGLARGRLREGHPVSGCLSMERRVAVSFSPSIGSLRCFPNMKSSELAFALDYSGAGNVEQHLASAILALKERRYVLPFSHRSAPPPSVRCGTIEQRNAAQNQRCSGKDEEGEDIGVHAASCRFASKPSAVTMPPDAAMIRRIMSAVMFWLPCRMREMVASLMGGSHMAPSCAAFGLSESLRYWSRVMTPVLHRA